MKQQKRIIETKMWIHKRRTKLGLMAVALLGSAGVLPIVASANQDGLPGMGIQPVEYFYTGKPYDTDSESYTFRYRNYDPELNRWTTVDPSGFPDWPNNYLYSNNPLNGIDRNGLYWQVNTGGGGAYSFVANAGLSSYVGHNVAHPNPGWSGQCATGAQYAAGTYVNNALHDAPKTSTWQQGSNVAGNSSLQSGTMIAYGWENGEYPNAETGNHTALYKSQTETTITVIEQHLGENGNPVGFHEETYNKSDFDWYEVTSDEKYDGAVTESIFE